MCKCMGVCAHVCMCVHVSLIAKGGTTVLVELSAKEFSLSTKGK